MRKVPEFWFDEGNIWEAVEKAHPYVDVITARYIVEEVWTLVEKRARLTWYEKLLYLFRG